MCRGGRAKATQVVTTLEHRNQPSAGVLVGDLQYQIRQLGEIPVGESKASERVVDARVEARRNQHQIRLEAFRGRREPVAKHAQDLLAACACREWAIHDAALALALPGLARVAALLHEHAHDLGAFITADDRGKHVPAHLAQLSEHLLAEQEANRRELDLLRRNVDHIKEIVAMQQSYAKVSGVKEMINVAELVEDSLRINADALSHHHVKVVREFANVPVLNVEKHKMLQIIVNLLRNAKHACQDSDRPDKQLTVRVANGDGRVKISVIDNGIGIPPENLTRIFNHGFTTRKDGHGFGLHSGALAANEMGGSLTACSDGPGQGAAFTLELPCPAQEGFHE